MDTELSFITLSAANHQTPLFNMHVQSRYKIPLSQYSALAAINSAALLAYSSLVLFRMRTTLAIKQRLPEAVCNKSRRYRSHLQMMRS